MKQRKAQRVCILLENANEYKFRGDWVQFSHHEDGPRYRAINGEPALAFAHKKTRTQGQGFFNLSLNQSMQDLAQEQTGTVTLWIVEEVVWRGLLNDFAFAYKDQPIGYSTLGNTLHKRRPPLNRMTAHFSG